MKGMNILFFLLVFLSAKYSLFFTAVEYTCYFVGPHTMSCTACTWIPRSGKGSTYKVKNSFNQSFAFLFPHPSWVLFFCMPWNHKPRDSNLNKSQPSFSDQNPLSYISLASHQIHNNQRHIYMFLSSRLQIWDLRYIILSQNPRKRIMNKLTGTKHN